ncbi:leucine--tRNA ligase [Pseudochryseolinea flava]|uniref:Leucine--tRNA ligase n=1 Tax=Pseudochryseolinea flava TaxID=2059302 RepID=A0A364XUZ3_9BACT|nr:leucine--tRNA ligase [Pseudochryseolinea flava]RAV98087.1 leucine--tRNA ligase [Pseudochryseolinea flava]
MADYSKEEIKRIEQKWQEKWATDGAYKVVNDTSKPKYYALDMFPYPSGAGLHVGHPLGYIASDIVSRYKRIKGFNVLHPMGFDAFGLPAEQYAIQTGQHPRLTTEKNIETYKRQLKQIGFSYDWDREVQTSDPQYYRWTQWIFMQLFNSWYNKNTDSAEPISKLTLEFEKNGNAHINAVVDEAVAAFTGMEWKAKSEADKEAVLQQYRIAYLSETMVNWCAALGTVLSNDEVKDGVSERGGYPVERIKMMQWSMRITAYAERLLKGLDTIDWPEAVKEMQRNWIGKSMGCELTFPIVKGQESGDKSEASEGIKVFTTRIDTVFGVTFLVLAPEHELVDKITTAEQRAKVDEYVSVAKNRSERERMSEVKRVSGAFTGAYAKNPFNNELIPIWIADYVLAGYGTGAVMAVPGHDERDHRFAKHYNLPIVQVVEGPDVIEEAFVSWEAKIINSGFMNGMVVDDAIQAGIDKVEEWKIGKGKINYRMRDAIFGRQRYWGEPFPVYFVNGLPKLVDDKDLPVTLPDIDQYKPTETGEPPLGRAKDWNYKGHSYELTTMPGWAGSSWYWFRYMDPKNENQFVSKEAQQYWKAVDLYIGGSEHATGHLLYSRFWCKVLKDLGHVDSEEPFLKMINQGHIQGVSKFVYRINGTKQFVSAGLRKQYEVTPLNVDINMVENDALDIEAFKNWREDFADATFILEDGRYICGSEVEKMSKSKYNVVNPDDIVSAYGADTLRMYEMFLGPLELSKPWATNGIDGVYKFLRKFWNLFHDANGNVAISNDEPTKEEYKVLHKTLKKIEEDIETFSFNTSVSEFMICCNFLTSAKCNKRAILEPLVIALSPFAPHIAEELWSKLGHSTSILTSKFVSFDPSFLIENSFEYPISINGKVRAKMNFALDMPKEDIEKLVIASEIVQKWAEGKPPKKVIIVPGKIVNVVL